MILTESVTTKWCGANKKRYIELGYEFTKMGELFEVKVVHLPEKSNQEVEMKCESCGTVKKQRYSLYTQNYGVKNYGKFYCNSCTQRIIKSYSVSDISSYISQYEYKLIDDMGYKTMHDKIKIQCNKGHVYVTEFNVFKQGYRCPECYRKKLIGENNHNYNPNLTDEERLLNESRHSDPKYRKWFRRVFKRDNYTCKCCGKSSRDRVTLNAHHLDGFGWCEEKRYDLENGITLCERCHKDFHSMHGYGNNTREQYIEYINNIEYEGVS